jgi:hypothetical protein
MGGASFLEHSNHVRFIFSENVLPLCLLGAVIGTSESQEVVVADRNCSNLPVEKFERIIYWFLQKFVGFVCELQYSG